MYNCYGYSYGKIPECQGCPCGEYCKDAGNPPLISASLNGSRVKRLMDEEQGEQTENRFEQEQTRSYTRADLLEVINFLASLDQASLEILNQKLTNPTLNISELARWRGTSRQAMHKMVERKIEKYPELAAVVTYRKHRKSGRATQGKMSSK